LGGAKEFAQFLGLAKWIRKEFGEHTYYLGLGIFFPLILKNSFLGKGCIPEPLKLRFWEVIYKEGSKTPGSKELKGIRTPWSF